MGQDGDVDGRDFIERKGWAVAPSLAFGLEGDTRTYFYLLHTEQDNIPDGGVPTIGLEGFYNPAFDPRCAAGPNAGVVPAAGRPENFYGFASDFEEIKGTMFTARFEHDFSDNVTLRNTSRYGKLHQFYVLTGVNALTVTDPNPDLWTVARTRQSKFQDNTLLTNQTNITANLQHGRRRPRHHRRLRVHRRRAVQPDLRRASARRSRRRMSTTRTATTCCPATRRCATACTRAAKRRPPACTCSTP